MSEIKRVKIDSILESQIPEFLNEESPLFKEFLKQYYYSLEHQSGAIDLINNLKEYKNVESFNQEALVKNTNLTSDVLSFDETINVDSTIGWPDRYGLLKIDDEIITYLSKTENSFVNCIRGFSGIDNITSVENVEFLNFSTTSVSEHLSNSEVKNLSNLFLVEFFQKYRFEFFPGFESRNFVPELSLPNVLTGAKNFYSSKGTDSSYKLLFKILYGADIEIIKPQDSTLVPSSNSYFITKNILVEKISGVGNPTDLPGSFLYQTLPGIGTASASIFNVEFRPINKKELYEISLDSTSLNGTFQVSGNTKIMEDVEIGSDNILVDSTIGFSRQGVFVIKTKNSDLIRVSYNDKTINQFLEVTGVDRPLEFGTEVVEEKFAFSSVGFGNTSTVNFRVINVIDSVDSSKTSNMRIGDKIKLSGFGKNFNTKVEFNSWIYNIPTNHLIKIITKVNTNTFRITLYDGVYFYLNEIITLIDRNQNESNGSIISIEYSGQSKKFSNQILVQIDETTLDMGSVTTLRRKINKSNHNINYFPQIDKIPTGVQNTYLSKDNFMYVASSGLPNYTIYATDNKIIASTLPGVGKTDIFYAPNHPYSTGESIYYRPTQSSGIGTGIYQITKIDNNKFKLSFSKSDIFSNQYLQANSGITESEIVKFGYQNKNIKNQKLFKKIKLFPSPLSECDDINQRSSTGVNKQIGILINGTEVFSPTIFDESIYYGQLNSIKVIDSGSGYDVIDAPNIKIIDDYGSGVKASLNIVGSVKKVKIISPGIGYQIKPKITVVGGNGKGCILDTKLVSSRISSSFKGSTGVNAVSNTITFQNQIAFEDNEEVIYNSNLNIDIPGIVNQSNYFIGIVTDNVIKLYNNRIDSFNKVNEINILGISSGSHSFTTLTNKNTISEIYVKDSGKGYSNRSIRVPSILSYDNNTLGINTFDSYIFAKNHGFNSGEIVRYSYTETPISGLSSQISYYIDKVNSDKFKLCSAGIGETLGNVNFINKKYESLSTLGVGTHAISYPPIEIVVESLSAIGSSSIISPVIKPIVLGSIEDVFLENGGVSFGCTDIVNFHRRPFAGISSVISQTLIKPIIIKGSIVDVQIINKGKGYGKDADITISGVGKFAEFQANVENGSLISIDIINGGVGYAITNTTLNLKNKGTGLKLLANVNEWKINQVIKSKKLISSNDDGLIYPNRNESLELQFINLYIPKKLRLQISDNINSNFTEVGGSLTHSPILGYAYDGNPIYGPYGYDTSLGGPIKRLVSGYVANIETNSELRPPGFEVGYFIDDYKFIATGDLDQYNGRFCITPEFPNGIYAYFSTILVSSSGSGQNVPAGLSIPTYPYVIGDRFKDVPILNNFLPKFNQDLDVFDTSLTRNVGPYYLNYTNSGYGLIDTVLDDYKQELRVKDIHSDVISDAVIFSAGDNYQVGDNILLDNTDTEGGSANIVVSRISGKEVSNFQVFNNLIENVEFTIRSNNIIGETSSPHGLLNNQPIKISGISTITSSNLEGIKYIKVNQKEVQLLKNIPSLATTGISTIIVVNDVTGFQPNDFIGIGTEILQITKISKKESYFNVNRISYAGIHTIGIDNVKLLPTKFEFFTEGKVTDYTLINTKIFFNPKEDIGTGVAGTTRSIIGLSTYYSRIIPTRSIYIPGHKFFTGEKLIYNCGFGGTSLFVNNVGSGVSFKLENNREVYAVNLGNDYLGISTIGFTSTTGIGSQFNSLEFQNLDQFFGVIGVAHSLTTTNLKITGTIQTTSAEISTIKDHGLLDTDEIKLKVNISDQEEIKVVYDPVNRKVLMKEIAFTNSGVSTTNNTIDISSYDGEIKTGDKVVYISETPIGGLTNYGIYYVLKDSFNKIKLSQYISDIYPNITVGLGVIPQITNIKFNTTGGSAQKLYFINPPLQFFKGNVIKFDISDPSLSDMDLVFYADSKLDKKIEVLGSSAAGFVITRNGIPGNIDSYVNINTFVEKSPRVFYYNLISKGTVNSEKIQISIDASIVGNNHIFLSNHSLNDFFKINISDNNTFNFVNDKILTYVELQSLSTANITYDTNSKNALGPISKLKINFPGRGYKKLPSVKGIKSTLGTNAVIKLISPNIGRIESFSRIKDGFDYPTDPTLSPTLSVPSVVGIKDIRSIENISVVFGGNNYNVSPTLVVPQKPEIKLQANSLGGAVESVKIIKNSNELSGPLEIVSTRNSNGYDIDIITVNANLITLELLITDLISASFGTNTVIFPFSVGDQIFIENCRLTNETNTLANYNSVDYGYKFFTVVGIDTNNYTVTYDISSLPSGLIFGVYNDNLNLGVVVNKKDMPIFKMNLTDTVKYFSNEIVTTDNFNAVVMENGWDPALNQLRLDAGQGDLEVGDKLFGEVSKVNGTIEYFDTFILGSTLGVSRDKVGNVDNSVGILNDFQQRISDNFYYQKFSYSIKGNIPYNVWKESVRSLVHPSGFKEFSDLIIYSKPEQLSYSNFNLKPQILASGTNVNINIDADVSMYERSNFAKVYEEEFLSDGSIERVFISDGLVLKPYILNKTNKVLKIDDISGQFNGRSYQELDGRYADASDLLSYNRAFIQEEVVGFITATYPGITTNLDWDREICKRDVGYIVDAISHDTKYNSNNKSVEAGLSYWSGIGTSYVAGEEIETISGFKYISQLSKYIINNVGVQTSYQLSTSFNISNLSYNNITGVTTITTTAPHLLTIDSYVVLKNIVLSCNSGGGLSTAIFPNIGAGLDGNGPLSPKGFAYPVIGVGTTGSGAVTFTINPGVSTISHTYVSGGTVQKAFISFSQQFEKTILKDELCSQSFNENCCADVQSAISNYVGIITTIIGIGTTAAPSEITFPSLARGGSVVGLSTFKLKNKGTSLFKHTFNSQSTIIDVVNDKFIIPNHNYQSGQKLIYEYDNSPIGVATTSYVSGITSSLIKVGNFDGTAIFENGYSVAITTSRIGISTTLVPVGPSFKTYPSVIGFGTTGINAEFNVFLTYNAGTGIPIGTSIILNKGGRGFKVGDTVSIAGTYLGGSTPTNNLSFVVSKTAPTSISTQSNVSYTNIPSSDGSGSIFDVGRDANGFVAAVTVINGGVGYASTSIISIAGTYVGGTQNDVLRVSPTELGTKKLPRELYVFKLDDNQFKVSGLSTSVFLNLVGIGSGSHSLSYADPDPSIIITIDGVIQSALRRKSLQITLSEPISTASTTFIKVSSGISSLNANDIINVNNELMIIKSIGIPSSNNVQVERSYFDSISGIHTVGAACTILTGDFKINGDTIYFTTPPYGKIGVVGLQTGSNFGGRLFSRKFDPSSLLDKNILLDDISLSFTGSATSQFLLKSNGQTTQSIFNNVNESTFINNNPIILINNVFQSPGYKYVIEDTSENKVGFIDGTPSAGKIVQTGVTTGFGYLPLLVASATAVVSSSGTISSIILKGKGQGYRQSPVISIASTIGFGASVVATVGSGGTITGFTILNPGIGYTTTSLPKVVVGFPTGYSNLTLQYIGAAGEGQGAKITVDVGMGSSVISFKFDQTGFGYKIGDQLTPVGIPTNSSFRYDSLNISDVQYDNITGITTITTTTSHNISENNYISLTGIAFTCGYDEVGIQTFSYNNATGICTVTTYSPHGLLKNGVDANETSNEVFLYNLPFTCAVQHAGVTTTIFPDGTSPYKKVFPVLSSVGLNTFTMNAGISTIAHTYVGYNTTGISSAIYNNIVGIITVTTSISHGLVSNNNITLSGLGFTCNSGAGNSSAIFPSGNGTYGYTFKVSTATTNTFTAQIGVSTIVHYYNSGGFVKKVPTAQRVLRYTDQSTDNANQFRVVSVASTNKFQLLAGITTIPHYYTQNGIITFKQFEKFILTVSEVQTDKFSGFYPGQFIKFADISNNFNGFKKRFTVRAIVNGQSEIINLKVLDGSDLDITNNIFIYLNDVLQVPGESYTFKGSRVTFSEAPKPDSVCSIFYYRGSSIDVEEVIPPITIKQGDVITIKENKNDPFDIDQFDRVVKSIISSDQLDTFTYDSLGISTDPTKERPLSWIKQKNDRIINGSIYSKSRPNLSSVIRPQTRIIKNVNSDDTKIYVDTVYPIFNDVDGLTENLRDILIFEDKIIESATAQTQVSSSSSVSSINILSGGNGYKSSSLPQISISLSSIVYKDPLFNWSSTVGISPSYELNSISYGNIFVGVGNTQKLVTSTEGKTWESSTIGLATSYDFKSIISHPNNSQYIYIAVGSNGTAIRSTGIGNSISSWSSIPLKEQITIPGFGVIGSINSSYLGTLKEVVYSPAYNSYVTVGSGGSIFTGIGIGTDALINRNSSTLSSLNSVSFSFNASQNSGYFTAVGDNGTILTSNSGQIWDVSPTSTTETLNKVIFAEGKFVIVGNSGTVIKSINQNQYEIIATNIGVNFKNIKYNYGVYAALDDLGNLYYSLDLSYWSSRSTNQSNIVKDLIYTDRFGNDGRYVAIGFGGTAVYAEPIYNRATGIASVSSGIVTSITVINGGFGYVSSNPPQVIIGTDNYDKELIRSFKSIGDHGIIIGINTFITGTPGIGTTTPKIEFVLKSEIYDNNTLGIGYSSLNSFGIIASQLEKGDYFTIRDSNVTVGHALTGITTSLGGMSNYPTSKVATATSFIDGVYRVESVTVPVLGIVTVTCNFAPSSSGNFVQVLTRGIGNSGINTNNFYGNYSWGKIYDYQNRVLDNPKSFIVNTDNGIIGLSTSPKITRTRGLLSN